MHCDELDQSLVSSIASSVGKYYPPTSPNMTTTQQHQKAAFQVHYPHSYQLTNKIYTEPINYF